MKRFLTGLLLMATAGIASAHTLAGEEGLPTQLQHELTGAHHLLLTILLVVVGVVAYRSLRARRRS